MKPLSKQDLIKETKRIRDSLRGTVPDYLMISDEQIEKNVEKKYEVYAASLKFTYKSFANKDAFNKLLSEKNQKKYFDFRGSDVQGLEPEEFENHIKEVNTPEKAKHYLNQTVKRIISADYQELTDVANNLEKLPKYLEKNSAFLNQSMAATSLVANSKHKYKQFVDSNKKIFEGVAMGLKGTISFNAHPISMLLEGYQHDLPDKDCGKIFAAIISNPDVYPGVNGKNNLNTEQLVMCDSIASFVAAKPDKEAKIIHDYLVENNTKNLMEYYPRKEGQSLQEAIFKGDKLFKKSDEAIQEMNDSFNELEGVTLEQRANDKENSIPLSNEEKEKLEQYHQKLADEAQRKIDEEERLKEEEKDLRESKQQAIEDQKKAIVKNAVDLKKSYERQSRAARFFSHLLPNNWTKAGRIREALKTSMETVKSQGLEDEFNKAYNAPSKTRTGDLGKHKDDAIIQDVLNTEYSLNNAADLSNSTKKQREQSKSMIADDKVIDIPDEVEDEDEMETPTPKGRKSIEIADAKDTPNSSKENVAKEQSNQKAMEASNEMDDDELDLD